MPREDQSRIGLPPRVFMYTVDQIAVMLDLGVADIHRRYLFHEGRDIGRRSDDQMSARNIAPAGDKPEWRIVDKEFIRWMKRKGFKYYDRGTVTN